MKNILNSEFNKNIIILLTGTGIATVLPVAVSPILTRLYTPEDMGTLAVFVGVCLVLGAIINARYELAILLPEDDLEAVSIFSLSFVINCIGTLIISILLFFFGDLLVGLLENPELSDWLFLIPITVFLIGLMNTLNTFNNRLKKFKDIATAAILKSVALVITQLGLALLYAGPLGLIVSEFISRLFANLRLYKNVRSKYNFYELFSFSKLWSVVKRYKKFPLLDVPATLCNLSSFHMISLMMTSYFSASIAGYFFLTQRVLASPVTLLANAVSDVFKEKAARDYKNLGHAKEVFKSTFVKLLTMSSGVSILLYFLVEFVFSLVFGTDWAVSGLYAKILIPMLFFRFISVPLSYMFYIGEKQHLNLLLQAFLLFGIVVSFLLFNKDIYVVRSLSFVFSLFYAIQLLISAYIAKCFRS